MMSALKSILEDPTTPRGRWFALTIQSLIVISLATFAIETLPALDTQTRRWLRWVEIATIAIFSAEYIARLLVANRPVRFVLSFFGVIDLLSIIPFYLATGLDLRSLRIVRVMRVFRIFKLVRYSAALQRFHRAFLIAKEELVLFLAASTIVLYISAVGIYLMYPLINRKDFVKGLDFLS